ncbi:hypothetical protein [Hymenobacter arcticus]
MSEAPNLPHSWWKNCLLAHWLTLATYALYLGRWAQYAWEAATYRAQPTPGGAGDALNWLLLS